MYKAHSNQLSPLFMSKFKLRSHKYETRHVDNTYKLPKLTNKFSQFSLSYRGPKIWNKFLTSLKPLSKSNDVFKFSGKRHLLSSSDDIFTFF